MCVCDNTFSELISQKSQKNREIWFLSLMNKGRREFWYVESVYFIVIVHDYTNILIYYSYKQK